MKKKRNYSQRPMLYIEQPKLAKPSASMQSKYRTPKKKASPQEVKAEKALKNKSKFLQELKQDANKERNQVEEVDSVESNESIESSESNDVEQNKEKNIKLTRKRTTRKKFKDMTVEEKVDYFVGLPSQVPRMKCEVLTSDERLRGVIADYQDGIVHMVTYRHPRRREINMKDIEDIRLLSF